MRKKSLKYIYFFLFFIGILYQNTLFTINPEIVEKYHSEIEKLIIDNSELIWDLRNVYKNYDIVVYRGPDIKNLDSEKVEILKNWIEDGGSIYLKCRYSHNGRVISCDNILDEFGINYSKTISSLNKQVITINYGILPHVINTGVKKLSIDDIYSKFYYFTEKENTKLIPLLCTNDGKTVFTLFKYGKGRILIQGVDVEEEYDYERFWLNLWEFLAGYPIPESENYHKGFCPKCKRVMKFYWNYCPYDGSVLR